MSRDQIQKLLGGYATGTLTPEEQQALFEAALTDQELFNSLAREEALREVLSDPAARAHLLAAMDDVPAPWYRQWWRPMAVMAAAVLVVAGVAVWQMPRATKPLPMAKLELPPLPRPGMQSAPILPPPPQVKQPAPVLEPFSLPVATPVAPPPPPAAAAPAPAPAAAPPPPQSKTLARASIAVSGSIDGPPMQQSQQGQQGAGTTQGSLQAPAFQTPPANPQFRASAGNSLLERDSALLHGVVTDASGAGIRSAAVVVKSLSTGAVVNTSTDDHGEFKANGVPGATYQISASAPGFRSGVVSQVTPVSGTPEPVNLRLDVGSAAETVEVTAGASIVPATASPSGSGGGGGRTRLAGLETLKKANAAAGLEYHLLRRVPGGDPVEVPEGETVPPGASLILRVTPAADGYLRIAESTRTISSPKVKRGVVFETALPQYDKPGRVELQVYFSRQAAEAKEKAAKEQDSKLAPSATITIDVR
jgi:hypothetical protein